MSLGVVGDTSIGSGSIALAHWKVGLEKAPYSVCHDRDDLFYIRLDWSSRF